MKLIVVHAIKYFILVIHMASVLDAKSMFVLVAEIIHRLVVENAVIKLRID